MLEWIVLAGLGGWIWGSFLNTLVDRTPRRGERSSASMLRPLRSRCDACGKPMRWHDLIPIFSYLQLRGRCGACSAPIGRRTLVVELATPLLFSSYAWLLTLLAGYAALGALAGFGLATVSWLIVAVPLLVERRQPRPVFLGVGVGLLAALTATVFVVALSVMSP